MKKLITAIIVIASSTLFAQNNTLPITGSVGIGTITPSAKLDVNGNMIIDSCLLIKDSLIVNKAVRAMDRMIVEQKMTMKGNAVVKQHFRVNGNSRVDGNLRTFGNSRLEGLLKLPNTGNLSNANVNAGNFDVLLLNANGTAKKIDFNSFLNTMKNGIYGSECGNLGETFESPTWKSVSVGATYGYLYTGVNCPARVGIGTDTPLYELDVRGSQYLSGILGIGVNPITNTQVAISTSRRNGMSIEHSYNDPNGNGYTYKAIVNNNLTKGYSIYNNNYQKEVFSVSANGEMVLANETRQLFHVYTDGLLQAREIKVDLATWPDYVFEKNYELMPLREIEDYIKKEGHLPNIPNAEEVEKEGLNLGEMNKLLLEKIEELTLHLIEQEKRILQLEKSKK